MQVFLDMDGVLCNFDKALCERLGIPPHFTNGKKGSWDWHEEVGLTPKEFWAPTHDVAFWADLEWMPDGREILAAVLEYATPEDVCILSSPANPESAAGKMLWIEREIPSFKRRFLLGSCKDFLAEQDRLLIDDADHNVIPFVTRGGDAILVPRPWNARWQESTKSFNKVLVDLDRVFRSGWR